MWTEITKDLVSKEAIEYAGFRYEETGEFFYVMEYLRYVSRLHAHQLDLALKCVCITFLIEPSNP